MSILELRLLAEGAAVGELGLAAGGAGEDGGAAVAGHLVGGVAVDGGDGEAGGALDVHEEGVGALDKAGALVLLALSADRGVREIGVEESHVGYRTFIGEEDQQKINADRQKVGNKKTRSSIVRVSKYSSSRFIDMFLSNS